MKLKRSIFTALLAAILCILSPISVPIGGIPMSLSMFAVALVAMLADRRCALMAMILYVGLGAVGLPVFAGFSGGAHVLVGPTGGYLFGYIPMTLAVGTACDMIDGRSLRATLRIVTGLLVGLCLCYFFGAAWFAVVSDMSFGQAFLVAIAPFIIVDLVELASAASLGALLRHRIGKLLEADYPKDREEK